MTVGLPAVLLSEGLIEKHAIVIGVAGASPAVRGEGAINTEAELEAALQRAQPELELHASAVALVADVGERTFQALRIVNTNGDLRLFECRMDISTLRVHGQKALIRSFDMVYTWDGVVGISKLWFEVGRPKSA